MSSISCSSSVSSNSERVSSISLPAPAPRGGLGTIGALPHEIDRAHGLLAAVVGRAADRYLAQHELARRHALQRRQHVAHADLGGIDLVDEDDVRDVVV